MKTALLTIAMGLATMSMTVAQAQTPAPATQPAATAPAKTTKVKTARKHHKKAVKKSVKTPAASAVIAK